MQDVKVRLLLKLDLEQQHNSKALGFDLAADSQICGNKWVENDA